MYLWAALTLGFLSSFHCIGMCGPIALALPLDRSSKARAAAGTLLYNVGRMLTYSVLGLFMGFIGQGAAFAGYQNILSIVLGSIVLLFLLIPRLPAMLQPAGMQRLIGRLKEPIRKLFGVHSMRSLFLIGVLNGLLPCGMVYLGIAGAVATGSAVKGSLFMAAFGLGTLPAMALVSLAKNYINVRFRDTIRKMVPVMVGVMAVLLIMRGLNLGIPYISPKIVKTEAGCVTHSCCHKK
jgi:sulfite exporter TauE/SafE